MKLGLVQMYCPKGEIDQNLTTIEHYVQEAAARQVEIVCFPEMSITGYINPTERPAAVLTLENKVVQQFAAMTVGTGVIAIAGMVERNPHGKPFITQLIAADGALLGVYRKRHIVDDEAKWFAASHELPVFQHGQTTIGVTICADIDRPDLFAGLARQGARIVFEAAAPGLYGEQATRNWQSGFDWWQGNCRTKLGQYARENKIWIAVATQAGRTVDEDFPGGGYLFAPDGQCVAASADWSPGVLYAEAGVG